MGGLHVSRGGSVHTGNTKYDETIVDTAVADEAEQGGAAFSILVVDDEPGMRNFLKRSLEKHYSVVETAESAEEAEAICHSRHFDLIISDIRLPGISGVRWVQDLRDQGGTMTVIFITAHADLDTAIAALRAGAADFILKPFRVDQLLAAVDRCFQQQQMARENFVLRRQVNQWFAVEGMVGRCELMTGVCDVIKRVAPMRSTVLIEGESGTGKELAARAIHVWSHREGPFVPVNCAAFSAELLESELFGHVKGAFTGALSSREGLFTYAHGGTLFLDEIGEMPLPMQAKLLRVIDQRTIRPIGSNRETPVDVRIIAATNLRLADEVKAGRFREDLFYRLNVLSIRMPTLRERIEDVPLLVEHFATSLAAELRVPPLRIDRDELRWLGGYHWPGNVRELKNVMERALLLGKLPSEVLRMQSPATDALPVGGASQDLTLDEVERNHIFAMLDRCGGNKSEAARRLGIGRKTLERKLHGTTENDGD
ncbi:MAG: sigma-54 dependent transcriptional regulator [Chromatiales bacterium]|nr:sigma-54 dependent transcriptional regulator [Chromatiales bacterium]MDX9767753.1 sigma-54 dependent transcriptional regulator [Ectothiorhodospiraceae bacterium]